MEPLPFLTITQETINTIPSFKEHLNAYSIKQLVKDQIIFNKGDTPTAIYYLEQGNVLLTNYIPTKEGEKEIVIDCMQGASFLNLASLTNRQVYPYTTKVLSSSILRSIPITEFQFLLRNNPYLNQLVINSLVRMQEKNHRRYAKAVALDSKSRIISFIIDQTQEQGLRVGYEWVIRNFFSQKEIALLTNTARQTVSCILNELRRQRIIHYKYKYFIVRDLQQLEQVMKK